MAEDDEATGGSPPTGEGSETPTVGSEGLVLLDSGSKLAGRFRIEVALGRGAFGQVYRAHDKLLDRTVAVKVLFARRGSRLNEEERFLREARTIARLDHPHVVPLYDAGLLEGCPWMAMRLVQGRSLSSLIRDERRLSEGRARSILSQLLEALEHAHQRGIVHRDVKPSNIVVETRAGGIEHVWLLDFGIARRFTGGSADDHTVAGTPSYMAPEQITGRNVDARADLYAVGCLACELVSGVRSFEGASTSEIFYKVVHEQAAGLDKLEELAGAGYATLVRRALSKSPEDRPSSATEMLKELAALGQGARSGSHRGLLARLRRAQRPAAPLRWDGRDAVVAEGVSKSYHRGRPALSDLDLKVPAGSVFALLGNNASGKTTFLRTVVGLYSPDTGSVRVFGREPRRSREALLGRIGYVPEVPAAYSGMTVAQVLDFLRRIYAGWDQAWCYRLLERFDLPLNTRLRDLSRGLQTKVAVVSALGHRPELLVLDDPTLGLDAVVLAEFFDTLSDAARREGTTVLIASHHLDELEPITEHVVFLKEGRVAASGRLRDLQQRNLWVELTFRYPVTEFPHIQGFRRVRSRPGRLEGITSDHSTVDTLRALGPEQLATRLPTLKELFVGTLGHDVEARKAGASAP